MKNAAPCTVQLLTRDPFSKLPWHRRSPQLMANDNSTSRFTAQVHHLVYAHIMPSPNRFPHINHRWQAKCVHIHTYKHSTVYIQVHNVCITQYACCSPY